MKLVVFILIVSCLHVHAKGYGQESITLNEKGSTLVSVLEKIKRQTGIVFWYRTDQLEKANPVTIQLEKVPLKEALDKIFQAQPLSYSLKEKSVFVKPKETVAKTPDPIPPIDIKGRVVNERGDPVEGVNVKVKGSDKVSVTDANGEFSMITVEQDAVLIFTHISMETFEIKVSGRKEFAISLKSKISSLDELQITAYGATTKRLNTGNVSTVKASEIQKQPINNPLLSLQGRVTGLFITQNRGFAGGAVTIRVQGQNSMRSGSEPLYVVDGVPYVSQLLTTGLNNFVLGASESVNTGSRAGNPLNYINPSDIESIEVLKDADATAIYGSRAANGAILITTKKGKAGQTKVDVNFQNGWGQVSRKVDLLNTEQYLSMRREALKNDAQTADPYRDYDLTMWGDNRFTDWQKKLIGNTSKYTDAQVTVSGGNKQTQYLIGSGFHRETTVFPGDFDDKKGSLHFNINSISNNQKFRIQLSGNYLIDNNSLPADYDLTYSALTLAPNAPELFLQDGSINWALNDQGVPTWSNPLSFTKRRYNNKTQNLISNAKLSYQLLPQLEIKADLGYTNLSSDEIATYPMESVQPDYRPFTQRGALYANNKIQSWILEPQLIFKQSIWKGKLEALFGLTVQQNKSDGDQILGSGYNSDLVLDDIKSAATVTVYATELSKYKYNAVFGRLNYNIQNKYLLNLSARRDGSSRFGPGNRFQNFGAIGAAWIFSEESFVKNSIPFLSFGKFKFSYGTTGNDQIGDYKYLDLYGPISSVQVPYQGISSLNLTGLPNPNIQWEETKKFNAGIDLGFLNDRILFSFNYAKNRSSNQLVLYSLPISAGRSSVLKNLDAVLQNTNFEFSLSSVNFKSKDFSWSTNINLTIPKNKITSFPGLANSTLGTSYVVGYPVNLIKAYRYKDVDPVTGLYTFTANDGTITSEPDFLTDRTVLIDPNPKYYGGFQNSFTYKSFQFDFLFQFVKQIGQTYQFGAPNQPGFFNANQPTTVLERWQKTGDTRPYGLYSSTYDHAATFASMSESDAAYRDASYVRLKNVSLSWQAKESLMNKVHMKSGRLYVQAQNLFTKTNYIGLDPETLSSSVLPPLRVIVLGVQLGL